MSLLHPGQFASKGGVLDACSTIAWTSELSLLGLRAFWGVSFDFSKMFNMLSPTAALQVGLYMGLSHEYVSVLLFTILNTSWGMGIATCCPLAIQQWQRIATGHVHKRPVVRAG